MTDAGATDAPGSIPPVTSRLTCCALTWPDGG